MSRIAKNPNAFKWKCGRCDSWNDMEHGTCKKCGAMAHQFASAYRIQNELTATEENYYEGTAPHILMEMRGVRAELQETNNLLRKIADVLEEG